MRGFCKPLEFLEQAYSAFYRRGYVELVFELMAEHRQKCGYDVYHIPKLIDGEFSEVCGTLNISNSTG